MILVFSVLSLIIKDRDRLKDRWLYAHWQEEIISFKLLKYQMVHIGLILPEIHFSLLFLNSSHECEFDVTNLYWERCKTYKQVKICLHNCNSRFWMQVLDEWIYSLFNSCMLCGHHGGIHSLLSHCIIEINIM